MKKKKRLKPNYKPDFYIDVVFKNKHKKSLDSVLERLYYKFKDFNLFSMYPFIEDITTLNSFKRSFQNCVKDISHHFFDYKNITNIGIVKCADDKHNNSESYENCELFIQYKFKKVPSFYIKLSLWHLKNNYIIYDDDMLKFSVLEAANQYIQKDKGFIYELMSIFFIDDKTNEDEYSYYVCTLAQLYKVIQTIKDNPTYDSTFTKSMIFSFFRDIYSEDMFCNILTCSHNMYKLKLPHLHKYPYDSSKEKSYVYKYIPATDFQLE